VVLAGLALAACVPEPTATGTPDPSASASASASAPAESVESSAVPSDRPQALEIALPASCDALYSSAMRSTLDADLPPLNDPGVTLSSTRLEPALAALESGYPTLRCSWGTASDSGLSTNATILAPEDVPRIQDLLAVNGLVCADAGGGILCTTSGSGTEGESHFLRGNGWVATAWAGELPIGYTEDVAATLWG
jgi:hypothetical protein